MDVSERLTEADLAVPDYLAASHLHRYRLATRLCAGLRVLDLGCGVGYGTGMLATRASEARGVDVDAEVIAAAARAHPEARFEVGDALTVLHRTTAADVDVVVMFEALEHVPDPEAVLAELARLRADDVRLIVSVPNSAAFEEENPFHVTDFGWTEARRAFAGIDGATLLYQHLAEGSLIVADGSEPALDAEVGALHQAEPEYANAFLCVAGFDADETAAATAQLHLVATPSHNRYMLELERANTEVFRTNRQLFSQLLGQQDAAGALVAAKLERATTRADELQRELEIVHGELARERAWRDAPRYHLVDRVARMLRVIPIVSLLARGAWAVARRAFRHGPAR